LCLEEVRHTDVKIA